MKKEWQQKICERSHGVCRGCAVCNGEACRGEVPGIGGTGSGQTFVNNCRSWDEIDVATGGILLPDVGTGPMTGVEENIGDAMPEEAFQQALVDGAVKAGIFATIGDGTPDFKFLAGVNALKNAGIRGTAFIKPYLNNLWLERYSWAEQQLEAVGVDIDACTLKTVEGKAGLEPKTADQLLELKRSVKVPFIIKGICDPEQLELVDRVRPEAVVISNHGGRTKDNQEGIAWTLQKIGKDVRRYCGSVWVDSGLRTREHLLKASALGAEKVLIARPFIHGVLADGADGVAEVAWDLLG